MLDIIAELIGFFGAALIGLAVSAELRRARTAAIIGTALIIVAVILLILVVLGVAKA